LISRKAVFRLELAALNSPGSLMFELRKVLPSN
jgi:hypothetical protein